MLGNAMKDKTTMEEEYCRHNSNGRMALENDINRGKEDAKLLPLHNLFDQKKGKTFQEPGQKSINKRKQRESSEDMNEGNESKQPDLSVDLSCPNKQKFD